MRNPIVRSTLIVLAVWWLALTGYYIYAQNPWDPASWATINAGLDTITPQLLKVLAAALLAIPTVLAFIVVSRRLRKYQLRAKTHRGFTTSLGIIPPGLGEPKRARGSEIDFDQKDTLHTWALRLSREHPAHYALYQGIIEVLAANPDTPAAPGRQGHAGASLFEHSCNVARIMLEKAPKYSYAPKQDAKGRISYPLHDEAYEFDGDDPLIGLLGFAHDIGKIECFALNEDGDLVERRMDHDRVGALMVARLNEAWGLSHQDRKDLIEACAHYHHAHHMPITASDRSRALMEFLIACDNEASHQEGRDVLGLAAKQNSEEGGDTDEELVETLIDLMDEPDRINGNNRPLRLGFKHGGQLYLSEESVREALCSRLELPARVKHHKLGDGRYGITARLIDALDRAGVLYKEHDGRKYSASRAMWNVTFMISNPKNPDDRRPLEIKAMIVLNLVGDFAHLAKKGDSLGLPTRLAPLWGVSSARGSGKREDAPELTVIDGGKGDDAEVVPGKNEAIVEDEAMPAEQEDTSAQDASNDSNAERAIQALILKLEMAIGNDAVRYKRLTDGEGIDTDMVGVYLDQAAGRVIGFEGIQTLVDMAPEMAEKFGLLLQESTKEPGTWVMVLGVPA